MTNENTNPKELEGVTVKAFYQKNKKTILLVAASLLVVAAIYFLTKKPK